MHQNQTGESREWSELRILVEARETTCKHFTPEVLYLTEVMINAIVSPQSLIIAASSTVNDEKEP